MKTLDSRWDDALKEAVSVLAGDAAEGLILFLEQREDVVIELADPDGVPSVLRSCIHGLAGRRAGKRGPWVHLGAPRPEDAREVAAAAREGRFPGRVARRNRGETDPPPDLAVAHVPALLGALVEATHGLLPSGAVRARWVGFRQEVRVARGDGSIAADVRLGGRIRLEALALAPDPAAAVAEAVIRPWTQDGEAAVKPLPLAVATRLAERRRARRLPSGDYPVVFGPGTGGILAHEIVGHALEADAMLAGASWLAGARGQVAAADLTVVDDPRRGRAAWRIDDEGEPARPVALLRRGVVEGWLHDLDSALASGQPATGHGRRGSFRDPVRPRMGCTFVAAGRDHPAQALEGVADGIYVRRMEAATADPLGGRAVFRVTDADRIRRGRIEGPLVPHLLFVEGMQALAGFECIADDLAFDVAVGSCLRDGQSVATSTGAPTLRLASIPALF